VAAPGGPEAAEWDPVHRHLAALLLAGAAALVALAGCGGPGGTGDGAEGENPTETAATAPGSSAPPGSTSATPTPAPATSGAPPVTTEGPPPAPSSCPTFAEAGLAADGGPLGMTPPVLGEVSGLVASRANPGLLWVHNDSGDRARVYLVGEDLEVRTVLAVPGVFALDWEALAAGPGPGGEPWLWVADVGDNLLIRPFVELHGFPEPILPGALPASTDADRVVTLRVRYPAGPADVEAFAVDPRTGDGVLVTKTLDQAGRATVLHLPAEALRTGGDLEASVAGAVAVPRADPSGPRAADVAADGTLVLVKDFTESFLWLRGPDQGVADLLAGQPEPPCAADLGRCEAIGFAVDQASIYSLEEGAGKPLRRFVRTA
jgi:hypothetical protein